jgi:hypothetical protein
MYYRLTTAIMSNINADVLTAEKQEVNLLMEAMESTKIAIQNDLEDIKSMKKDMIKSNNFSAQDCQK